MEEVNGGSLVKLTGLWLNTARDGKTYFSGTLGSARVMIFVNSYKVEGDNAPDYIMYVSQKQDKPKVGQEEEMPW